MTQTTLPSRRTLIGLAAQAAVCRPALAAAAATRALRQIAAARGLLYGSVVRYPSLGRDRAYADMVARECGLYVCSDLHWDEVEPLRFEDDFVEPDAALAWAEAHAMQFSGVALLWGEHVPKWFTELDDRGAARRALTDHLARICRHYAGRLQSWDVVNEAIHLADGRPDGLRRNAFLEKVGPEYLDIAFRTARAADPKAILIYNDFDVELDLPRHRRRREALFGILDGFKARGTPIDAVGLQSHLALELMPHFDDKVYEALLHDLAARGLSVMLTELDVIDRGAPADIRARDAQVAAAYRRYLDVALASPAVKAVITWGLTDRDSWITNGHYPETLRADGLPPRPLPFGVDYLPKPAYAAIAKALDSAPPR